MAVSYNAQKHNTRLTDFELVREHVVLNSVRNVPRLVKHVDTCRDQSLSMF